MRLVKAPARLGTNHAARVRFVRSSTASSVTKTAFTCWIGDFNTLAPGEVLELDRLPAWIRALIWISGRELQRETIQMMLDAGYGDGYRTLHPADKG